MSPRSEEFVIFAAIAILVSLFAWIYTRDRQKITALWMLGWTAILVHFAAPAFDGFFPPLMRFTLWIKIATLIVAGSCFLLSVSEAFLRRERRIAFVIFISAMAMLYVTAWQLHFRAPWFYISLLLISTLYGVAQAVGFYSWKDPHLYALLLLLPYAGWAMQQALHSVLRHGLYFYLFGFFYVTALAYFRYFPRISPGVVLTSVSFMAWGSVFPLSAILAAHGAGPAPGSVFWDMPKFCVAFGMLLTLYEDQAERASTVAGQYRVPVSYTHLTLPTKRIV